MVLGRSFGRVLVRFRCVGGGSWWVGEGIRGASWWWVAGWRKNVKKIEIFEGSRNGANRWGMHGNGVGWPFGCVLGGLVVVCGGLGEGQRGATRGCIPRRDAGVIHICKFLPTRWFNLLIC